MGGEGSGRTTPEQIADERHCELVALIHERREYDVVEAQSLEGMLKTIGDTIVYYQRATDNVVRTMLWCQRRMRELVEQDRKENADHDEADRLVHGGLPR